MLSNMCSNNLTMLGRGVGQNPLDQVIAVLITGDINQGDSRSVHATLTYSVKVTSQKIGTTYLQAFFNDLRSILIHAVFSCVANYVINCSASVGRRAVFADVLNAPIAELSMGNDVNVGQDFFDTRTLGVN